MKASNFDIELAESRVVRETHVMVSRLQGKLVPSAISDCTDCGEPIEPARKRAMPSARRCISCQTKRERR